MKVTEYIVEYEGPADRGAHVVTGLDDLQDWLESAAGDKRIADALVREMSQTGTIEYKSDDPYDDPDRFGLTLDDIEDLDIPTIDRLQVERRTVKVTDAEGVLRALHMINVRRARTGQPALDPVESNWSVDDVFTEAKRLG